MSNALVYGGMLIGSILAWALPHAGIDARGTFLGASIVLGCGFLWALALVPDAFLRFLMVGLAHTIYRVRVVGRSNVPAEGGALLIPNHVTFADGLFIITSIDRPVRFMVYHEYFDKPFIGWVLRSMKAIPIASSGGPKMILHAFREAGKALDAGDIVCIFPEGQLTRTGLMAPFQRGLQRIVKGRTTPIIPVHLDRLNSSVFSPINPRRLPSRLPYPMTISFGPPLAADASLFDMRQSIRRLDQEAWAYRKEDLRPLHHGFIRQARKHPLRLALADVQTPKLSFLKSLAGAVAIARALEPRWRGQQNVGILLAGKCRRCARQPGGVARRQDGRQLELHHRPLWHGVGRGAGGIEDADHQPGVPRQRQDRAAGHARSDFPRRRQAGHHDLGTMAFALRGVSRTRPHARALLRRLENAGRR